MTKPAKSKKAAKRPLVFIDTNIFLDFYRERKSEVSINILEELEKHKDFIILGDQVEMEYKKNRQVVILETLGKFGSPDWGKLTPPALISEARATKSIKKAQEEIIKQQKVVAKKINDILTNPDLHDDVYKIANRIFKHKSDLNLNRECKLRFGIRHLARKRFFLGYPPRKKNDTSIGDAINWEWVIHCAKEKNSDVLIVSRDGDYGISYKDKWHINDWLEQEFKDRVNRLKTITLTGRLTDALKALNIPVTSAMIESEKAMIAATSAPPIEIIENEVEIDTPATKAS